MGLAFFSGLRRYRRQAPSPFPNCLDRSPRVFFASGRGDTNRKVGSRFCANLLIIRASIRTRIASEGSNTLGLWKRDYAEAPMQDLSARLFAKALFETGF